MSKTYSGRAGQVVVLREVSLRLEPGSDAAIVGPSGSGKSTLLHLLGGLDTPSSGTIAVNGVNPHTLAETELANFRNRTVGFVFQDHHLLPQCSVLENVLIPTLAGKGVTAAAQQRARGLLERVGLMERLPHRPAELSGGERQRVAIARALINQPTLVLADEPTGNLDRRTADLIAELLLELARQQGAILILVTHSMDLASRLSQRFELLDGVLVPRT